MNRCGESMTRWRTPSLLVLAAFFLLIGCAHRPINPPITQADPKYGYRGLTRPQYASGSESIVILAFSGGGTRAAAFSYGVLEFLRNTEVVGPKGNKVRLLDQVFAITGISGGSFTALAYGLYGDKLFDDYEKRFLKRDVQGEITSRTISPVYWPSLWSSHWGRSEMAADLYDEILFNGATFGDLDRGKGPMIIASATDITTGARLPFTQVAFDALCADLSAVRLSRAAAASSAVPVVLTPVTLNNYGGTCGYELPAWIKPFVDAVDLPWPAARATRHVKEEAEFEDGVNRPYIHVVDGGVSDNLGMRSVLDTVKILEALHLIGQPTPLDHVRRIVIVVVNSISSPKTQWDKSESPPGTIDVLPKAAGVPIRPLLLRGDGVVEGQAGAVAFHEVAPGVGCICREQGPGSGGCAAHAGYDDLCHRRVVCRAEGQGGTGLPERTAYVFLPAGRGRRPPARRCGGRPSWRRPISSGC